jgi:hypothetical protein
MSYETFYTASLRIDGVTCNPFIIDVDGLTHRVGLIRRAKAFFNINGVKCRTIEGIGPDGSTYIVLKPLLQGFKLIGKDVSILIEEKFTEDIYL